MIQVNRIYLIFNRLVTKKFLVDTSVYIYMMYPFNENMQQAFFQSGGNLFFLFHPLYGKDI